MNRERFEEILYFEGSKPISESIGFGEKYLKELAAELRKRDPDIEDIHQSVVDLVSSLRHILISTIVTYEHKKGGVRYLNEKQLLKILGDLRRALYNE